MQNQTHSIIRKAFVERYPFGSCSCGNEEPTFFNVGRSNWLACDNCKVRWCFGGNLMSSWRRENEEIWHENVRKYGEYRLIDGGELLREFDALSVQSDIALHSKNIHNESVDPTN